MDSLWVWIDGEIKKPEDARVSVLDHGFLYGDSIYETLRTHNGKLFAVEPHLDRLERSAGGIGLSLPRDRAGIRQAIDETVAASPGDGDVGIRLMVTRGVGPLGLDTDLCLEPNVIVFGWAIAAGRHPNFESGFRAIVPEVRRNPVGALDPKIKSGNFLNNILAYREARDQGVDEAILLTLDGHVAEGTTSNVFWAQDQVVYTPQLGGILPGVTRALLLELLEDNSIEHRVGEYPVESLRSADEIFITSTLKGVLPVVSLDGQSIGDGTPGPITRRIADLYEASC